MSSVEHKPKNATYSTILASIGPGVGGIHIFQYVKNSKKDERKLETDEILAEQVENCLTC